MSVLRRSCIWLAIAGFAAATVPARAEVAATGFPFRDGDRVAWLGSSSTFFGIWPRTIEFLLRTRHPRLKLQFRNFGASATSFATVSSKLPADLVAFKPQIVFLNFGANDSGVGASGLKAYASAIERTVALVQATGAMPVLMTPQAADPDTAKAIAVRDRAEYADKMLELSRSHGWRCIDIFRATTDLIARSKRLSTPFPVLADLIHLTPAAYVAWGFFLYDGLAPPPAESVVTIDTRPPGSSSRGARVEGLAIDEREVRFTRVDEVFPVLPPGPLPERMLAPLERLSVYVLQVMDLALGRYELLANDTRLGEATADELARGVNLNSVVLDARTTPPWASTAQAISDGTGPQGSMPPLKFTVRRL